MEELWADETLVIASHCFIVCDVLERTVLKASSLEEVVILLAGSAICCNIFALGTRELASSAYTIDGNLVVHGTIACTGVFSSQDLSSAIASCASSCVSSTSRTIFVTVQTLLAGLVIDLNSFLAHRSASPEDRVESHVAQTRSAVRRSA